MGYTFTLKAVTQDYVSICYGFEFNHDIMTFADILVESNSQSHDIISAVARVTF
jgi:hypothetical protein